MYFKVKIGFDTVEDSNGNKVNKNVYLHIDEDEYEKAVRAQITGKVLVCKDGTVSGNNIMSIEPDWNREMGWKRDYIAHGEDFDYIGSGRVTKYRDFQYKINNNVERQLKGLPPENEIEKIGTSSFSKEIADKMRLK